MPRTASNFSDEKYRSAISPTKNGEIIAATAAFIVLNKVSSPQYVLWVVPFLALLPRRSTWWWLLSAVAVVRYAGLFGVDVFPVGTHTADELVRAAVILQAALLVVYVGTILVPGGNARVRLPAVSSAT